MLLAVLSLLASRLKSLQSVRQQADGKIQQITHHRQFFKFIRRPQNSCYLISFEDVYKQTTKDEKE